MKSNSQDFFQLLGGLYTAIVMIVRFLASSCFDLTIATDTSRLPGLFRVTSFIEKSLELHVIQHPPPIRSGLDVKQ